MALRRDRRGNVSAPFEPWRRLGEDRIDRDGVITGKPARAFQAKLGIEIGLRHNWGHNRAPPSPAVRPTLTCVSAIFAVSTMTVMSEYNAMLAPMPMAWPLMRAMIGLSQSSMSIAATSRCFRQDAPERPSKAYGTRSALLSW